MARGFLRRLVMPTEIIASFRLHALDVSADGRSLTQIWAIGGDDNRSTPTALRRFHPRVPWLCLSASRTPPPSTALTRQEIGTTNFTQLPPSHGPSASATSSGGRFTAFTGTEFSTAAAGLFLIEWSIGVVTRLV